VPDYDVNEIARLLSEGKSMTEIATALDGPQVDQAAAQGRRDLQQARGALNAESARPGQEPDEDPVNRAFKLATSPVTPEAATDGRRLSPRPSSRPRSAAIQGWSTRAPSTTRPDAAGPRKRIGGRSATATPPR
jgi:hypothetical protein